VQFSLHHGWQVGLNLLLLLLLFNKHAVLNWIPKGCWIDESTTISSNKFFWDIVFTLGSSYRFSPCQGLSWIISSYFFKKTNI
jgi:hypothetical protein